MVEVVDGVGGQGAAVGIPPGHGPVVVESDPPPGTLLDPVVVTTQSDQVACLGRAARPRLDVVEVAGFGGDVTAGEPAGPIA